jgi:xanthine/CO dehydrogenase XdhC/CoxF family maturation factor
VKKLNEPSTRPWPPDLREKITGPGNEIGGGTPEEFAQFIAAENKRWARW